MGKSVNLGGDRLGSGNKTQIEMHGYSRSNHDLSYLWKSTMAPGTLVPFLCMVGLPGDTFDIDLNAMVRTNPTVGPLFGSFKLQLDVFNCPMRLYHKALHNNRLGVGMDMSKIKLPQLKVKGKPLATDSLTPLEFQQINQSSILAYLGLRGIGMKDIDSNEPFETTVNAVPYLAFWDIFKNYYANKQEEKAYVIKGEWPNITQKTVGGSIFQPDIQVTNAGVTLIGTNLTPANTWIATSSKTGPVSVMAIPESISISNNNNLANPQEVTFSFTLLPELYGSYFYDIYIEPFYALIDLRPVLEEFDLKNIDTIKDQILSHDIALTYTIDQNSLQPYSTCLKDLTSTVDGVNIYEGMNAVCPQSGLPVKTYQSDLFNNWIQTEWIDGENGISQLTSISTAGNKFTIDSLNIAKKVYDMLNRIAVSGGSYEDYIEATYDHSSKWRAENPVYCGGLSKEIIFEEIISLTATSTEPLGTLAGKGTMSGKHKGGHIIVNCDEPSFIIGIVSITPRITYSQGNDWYLHGIKTLADLHKPALDGIGFQDLLTDWAAFWTTNYSDGEPLFQSLGKIPAWLNYMTNIDKSYGNFADSRNQMFMTLDRRYSYKGNDVNNGPMFDGTTYIDPSKFNYAFAQSDLSAQNFWVQIANNIYARRKMSAKSIPNL